MNYVTVHGSSDDLVQWDSEGKVTFVDEPDRVDAEYDVLSDLNEYSNAKFAVVGDTGAVVVTAFYDGVWHFSTSIEEENTRLPLNCSIDTFAYHGYSMGMTITSTEPLIVFKLVRGA